MLRSGAHLMSTKGRAEDTCSSVSKTRECGRLSHTPDTEAHNSDCASEYCPEEYEATIDCQACHGRRDSVMQPDSECCEACNEDGGPHAGETDCWDGW